MVRIKKKKCTNAHIFACTHKRKYLIFDLKILRFSESLILLGKSSHIFGPRKDIISEP